MGGYLARTRGDSRVISLDKANVLATSRLWRSVVEEVYKNEFPELKVEHQLIDSAAMIMVKNPTQLNGVMIAPNLAGDILSDEASAIAGSIGLLPSASLCGIPSSPVPGIYEPIHGETPILFEPSCRHQSLMQMTGSAPDISGKGIVVRQDPVLGDSYPFAASTELT
ncbi:3-isopropylmalate dehydrogenase [Fusarium solani]